MYVKQVGGSHYGGTKFQHWDFVLQCNQDYLSAVATKYLTRWRDKGGVQDVQKAISYVDKMIAACEIKEYGPTTNVDKANELWPRYLQSYPLSYLELGATHGLIFWRNASDLENSKNKMQQIIAIEVFSWPELSFLKSRLKPDGWQGFTYEGTKEDFSWHRCVVCRAQFEAPIDMPPMLYHECPRIPPKISLLSEITSEKFPAGWHGLTSENGYKDEEASKPTPAYVNQGGENVCEARQFSVMMCVRCALNWDVSDPNPPPCGKAFDNPRHGHPPV